MNYDHPELASRLASEYVLGTLRGPARRRFQRLLLTRPLLRSEVLRWEQRLGSWSTLLGDEAEVPEIVWARIQERLHASPASTHQVVTRKGWRWSLALAAGLLAIVVAGRLLTVSEAPSTPVAVLAAADGAPRWVVSLAADQLVLARIGGTPAFPADRSTELWAVPAQGGGPRSLGVVTLVNGQARLQLSAPRRALIAHAAALAISLEPLGGSPTGSPTGPVVLTSPLSAAVVRAVERT